MQNTREGYNILNVPSVLNITSEEVNRLIDINIDADTKYTIKADKIETDSTEPTTILFRFIDSDNADIAYIYTNLTDKHQTFSLNKNAVKVRIYSSSGHNTSAETNTTFTNLMIYKGTDLTKPYEPYGAMPSPEFPSSIRNCGDNVNIFDMDTAILKQYNHNGVLQSINRYIKEGNKTKITYSVYQYGRYFFDKQKLQKGTYTYSFDVYLSNDATNLEGIYSIRNFTNSTDIKPLTIITLSKNKKKFSISFEIKEEAEVSISLQPNDNNSKILYIENLKLEQGLIATPYSPYNCSNVNITVCNENFLDTSDFEIVGSELDIKRNENGSFTVNGTSTGNTIIKFKKKIKMNGSYTLIEAGEKAPVSVYTTLYKNIDLSDAIAFIDSYSTARYANFEINTVSLSQKILFSPGTYNNYVIKPMLIEGTFNLSNIGDYIEHQSQTITFPLAEGQVLHKDDYLADDGIHHKRKQIVLDGSDDEGWTINQELDEYISFYSGVEPYKLITPDKFCYCSHFGTMYVWSVVSSLNAEYLWNYSKTSMGIKIKKSRLTSINVVGFKAWLSENPIKIEYELAEEEIEPYTTEQQEAYNKIKELYSYKGTTHITCENELSCIFQIGYYKDLETILNNMQAQILAE